MYTFNFVTVTLLVLFFCSLIHDVEGVVPLYSFYTPSHQVLKDDWFLPSLQDNFDVHISFYPQECTQAAWMAKGWTQTTLHKIELILEAIEQHWNDLFIYADIDIQFFAPIESLILNSMQGKDIVFQKHNQDGEICSGFFVCRANQKTRKLFQDVYERMKNNSKISDQPALNYYLITCQNPYNLDWDYLPDAFFAGGTLKVEKRAWKRGDFLEIPEHIVLHHANCTRGVKNKVAQLLYVKKQVLKRCINQ